jgi:hypothetical protein
MSQMASAEGEGVWVKMSCPHWSLVAGQSEELGALLIEKESLREKESLKEKEALKGSAQEARADTKEDVSGVGDELYLKLEGYYSVWQEVHQYG